MTKYLRVEGEHREFTSCQNQSLKLQQNIRSVNQQLLKPAAACSHNMQQLGNSFILVTLWILLVEWVTQKNTTQLFMSVPSESLILTYKIPN